jgi:malate dehydrogenase (oxaloacetate-decarboxylating)(NADP+)
MHAAHEVCSVSNRVCLHTLPLQVFPAQANNALIFPAVGHAAVLTRCSVIPPEVFLRAAESLAGMASAQQLQQGRLFPALSDIRTVQAQLCAELGAFLVQQGLGQPPARGLTGSSSQQEWLSVVRGRMFHPALQLGGGGGAGGAEGHASSSVRSRL